MAKRNASGKSPKGEAPEDAAEAKPKTVKKSATKKAATRKSAAKKSSAKKAVATKTEATSGAKKPAARKSVAKKGAAKKAAARDAESTNVAVVAAEAHGDEAVETGVIRPKTRRPATKLPVNGALLYRQQRDTISGRESHSVEEETPELPEIYGHTHIAALIRDSEWIFVYWEFTPATRAEFQLENHEVSRRLTLRLYDITGISSFDGANAHSYVDVPVNTVTTSWYLHVPESGRAYVVEIGLMDGDGFRAIARSNEVEMPRHKLAETTGRDWSHAEEEAHRQILLLSGGPAVPLGLSSAEFVDAWNSRLFSEGAGFSGTLFSGSILGGASEQSSSAIKQRLARGRERGFWLKVDAEVIVYGATDPNAKVRFMGRDIELGPDGTFGIRMALPDGTIEFPVVATSPDEQETREVCPVVTRRTR